MINISYVIECIAQATFLVPKLTHVVILIYPFSMKIFPFAILAASVAAGVALRKSLLSGLSADKPGRVAKGAVIEGSTLQGAFDLHNKVIIQNSMLQGPFEIAQKVTLSQCQLSALYGSKPVVIKSDMSKQMMLYPAQ